MSGVTEGPKKSSPIIFILLGLVLLIAAGGYFGVSYWEKEEAKRIEAAMKTWPDKCSADSIKVSFWSKGATFTGFKYYRSLPGIGTVDVNAESLTLAGVNIGALNSKGVVPLCDSATLLNSKMTFTQTPQPGSPLPARKQEASAKSLILSGARGDLAGIMEELQKGSAGILNNPQAALRLLALAKSFHIGSVRVAGYETRENLGLLGTVTASVESSQTDDIELFSYGQSSAKNFKVSAMNQEMVSIGALSMRKLSIPDVFSPVLVATAATGNSNPEALKFFAPLMIKELDKTPFSIKDLTVSDMSVKVMSPEAITLKNATFNFDMNTEKLTLSNKLEDLVIPPSYYGMNAEVGAMLVKAHGKPLNLSSQIDLVGLQKNGVIDLQVKEIGLKEQAFGSASMSMDLVANTPGADTLEKLLAASPEWLMKKAQVTLEDKKMLQLALAIQQEQMKNMGAAQMDVAALRATMAQKFQAQASASANPDQKALMEGAAKLVQQPGTLVINLNPEKPVSMNAMALLMGGAAPGAYKITTQYTPGK